MTIYIESFLIQNFLINFCLLRLVFLTTKNQTTFFKLTLSAIIGSIFSVVSAMVLTNSTTINILKFACAILMILIPFKLNLKQLTFSVILLFCYTFAFGGAILNFATKTYLTNFGCIISSKFCFEIVTLILIALTYLFELISKHLKHKLTANNYIFKTTLYCAQNSITINAYLDTGNLLEHNGKPIIVLDLNSYLKLSNNDIVKYFNNNEKIEASTVSGANSLKVFKIDKIKIETDRKPIIIENQLIAVSTKSFKETNYQALLSPYLF